MKKLLIILAILFSANTLTAQVFTGTIVFTEQISQDEKISTNRFFYVTYRYVDMCGVGRVSSFVWSTRYAYPKQSDLQLKAAYLTCGDHRCIQITGIDAICQADYKSLSR